MGDVTESAEWFESDGKRLFGVLHRSERESRGAVLLLHGFTGNHIGPRYAFVDMARKLAARGFAVFRFDYAGSGDSEGAFHDQHIDSMVRDTENAVDFLGQNGVATRNLGLVGHSMGGTVAFCTADRLEDVDALVAWATPADYADTLTSTEQERMQEKDTLRLFGFDYPVEHLERVTALNILERVAGIRAPLLVIHGEKDRTVPVTHARRLYEEAAETADIETFPKTGHDLLNPGERADIVENTVEWLATHMT